MYNCICGKQFETSASVAGHKSHCKEYLESKGKLDSYLIRKESYIKTLQANNEKLHESYLHNKQIECSQEYYCENCGKLVTEKFGSGRFCSRACANRRNHTYEVKQKISNSINNYYNCNNRQIKYNDNPNKCLCCGKTLSYDKRRNKVCSRDCSNKYVSNLFKQKRLTQKELYGKNIPGRHIVYKVINDFDDRYYIGVRKTDLEEFDGYLGSGVIITRMVNKYGAEHFTRITLFEYNNSEEAFNKEKELLAECINDNNCINIASGGQGGYTHGIHHST